MPGPHDPAASPEPPARPGRADPRGRDGITDLVRWAAFSCVLVPVVLLWSGASLAGATGTALGLAAVTGTCRVLLRRSERCAASGPSEEPREGPLAGPSEERSEGARGGGRRGGRKAPVD